MRSFLYILTPKNSPVSLCAAIDQPSQEFNNGQEIMDWTVSQLRGAYRFEVSEYNYQLDQNYAEQLNTSSMVFVHARSRVNGIGHIPIGNKRLQGPIVVCTDRYRGFSEHSLKLAASMVQHILDTSIPDTPIDEAKSFEDLMRECKAK